ncbi:uncharacterized protein LOC130719464 [Lotus japonicus]|uniref:uncharacterized protein LOC130719464 n=1 Tax=Lotus japonicus TaxID=34305 RepID=UPI00258357EF|nr:uncharacterized protein LOC130719464 [Lotus japonicus]
MSSFPSSDERTVASSLLLLLSTSPSPSLSTPKFDSDSDDDDQVAEGSINEESFKESSVSWCSNSFSSSSLINDDSESSEDDDDIRSLTVSSFSATDRYHQMKFKIARKTRSKVKLTSSCSVDRKMKAAATAMVSPVSVSGEATSCLSSSSSGISSARSLRYANRSRVADITSARVAPLLPATPRPVKKVASSPHLRRRGEAILKLLSHGGWSEVRIRQMLGDSPDTSKALRMLLRVNAVKRSGSGGRHDPFVYTIRCLLYEYFSA